MSDPDDPPRKHYELKPREFERVNAPPAPPSQPLSPADAPSTVSSLDPHAPVDVRSLARMATHDGPLLSRTPHAERPNDVHAILRHNLAVADAAGLNQLSSQPRRTSRRTRDFWLLLLGGNLLILAIFGLQLFVGFQVMCLAAKMPLELGNLIRYALGTPHLLAIPALGSMFYSSALAWLMFGVMNRY